MAQTLLKIEIENRRQQLRKKYKEAKDAGDDIRAQIYHKQWRAYLIGKGLDPDLYK